MVICVDFGSGGKSDWSDSNYTSFVDIDLIDDLRLRRLSRTSARTTRNSLT